MTKKEDLEIGFDSPSCSNFVFTSEYFPWFKTNIVILCFDYYHKKSCYSFDGQLIHIGDSNNDHLFGGLAKYNESLLTVGGYNYNGNKLFGNQKTEILQIDENKNFSWSLIKRNLKFAQGEYIEYHSVVTVGSSDINQEFVLLIGGYNGRVRPLQHVFKFNGTWFPFGQLNKPRKEH